MTIKQIIQVVDDERIDYLKMAKNLYDNSAAYDSIAYSESRYYDGLAQGLNKTLAWLKYLDNKEVN